MGRELITLLAHVSRKYAIAKTLLFVCLAFGSMPAYSQDNRASVWVVEPLSEAAFIEIGRDLNARLDTRLLPVKLTVLSQDLIDPQGKLLAIKGSQSIWVPKHGGLKNRRDIYCQMRNVKYAREGYWRGSVNSNKLICFSDDDDDGSFDNYQLCSSQYPSLLNDGKCHEQITPIASVDYQEVDRGEFKSDLIVGLNINGKGGLVQCVRHIPDCQPLDGVQETEGLPLGSVVSWLGSDIKILERKKSSIKAEIIPIPEPRVMMLHAPWVLFDIRL